MSQTNKIESGEDFITAYVSFDKASVAVRITESDGELTSSAVILLTTTQVDLLIRALATARVELSKARP